MTSISEAIFLNIIEKITLARNLKNWRCSQQKFESVAQNYFGVIIPVTLSGEENGILVSLELALKLAPMDERYRVSGAVTQKTNKRYMDIMIDRLCKALKKFEDSEYVPLLESLRENCSKCFEVAVSNAQSTCICHGDIWKENILFKYEDGTPMSACLIDYQTTRICTPAFDTLYLIISSTDTHIRNDHYTNLLDLYYQSFDQTLREAGLESHKIYSRKMFDQDLHIVWPACLITANTALWLSSGLQEAGHVRSKKIWSTPEEKEKAANRYKEIIKAITDDFCSYGYLDLKTKRYCF